MKIIGLLFLACVSLSSYTINQSTSGNEYFKIEIEQDGKILKQKKDRVTLSEAPFKVKLTYYKTDHIYVSISWGTYYFNYPEDKNIFECNDDRFFKDCRFVAVKTGTEEKFNEDKDIYVGDGDYQNVWFYKEEFDWHRMDKEVKVEDGIVHATVTIENIFDCDKRDSRQFEKHEYNYAIEKIEQDIYLVFATDHYEKGMEHPEELQREKILLKFK